MAKRLATLQEQLARVDYVWVKGSDTRVRCRRPACQFNQKSTYHKFMKQLDGKKYFGWFCAECHHPSPFTEDNGYTQETPSSLTDAPRHSEGRCDETPA